MTHWRDWRHWWSSLGRDDRRTVRAWLVEHPPPDQWIEGKIAYAFTEMPSRVLSRSSTW
jgi:hypothetical protein